MIMAIVGRDFLDKGLPMAAGSGMTGLGLIVLLLANAAPSLACQPNKPTSNQRSTATKAATAPTIGSRSEPAQPGEEFDGEAAFRTLEAIVALGPRITGSGAMSKQQEMLQKHFEALGAKVWYHKFPISHPRSGRRVEVKNMIVTWHPNQRKRIMLCTHFDTRPQADKDPKNPRGAFQGANDGASGVGVFAELGRFMPSIDASFGVDFVFFDAEEFVFEAGRDPLFVGSTGFANAYVADPARKFDYTSAVLIDMIGDAHLDLYWEKNSMAHAEPLMREIWSVASDLNIVEFRPEIRHEIRDDHLPLITIAKIPSIDIIDFDFPTINDKNMYWHTQQDTPDKCSAESLSKVGRVLLEWLRRRAAK
jgi:Zn-dependent M28 family amino/carboxypeptidase